MKHCVLKWAMHTRFWIVVMVLGLQAPARAELNADEGMASLNAADWDIAGDGSVRQGVLYLAEKSVADYKGGVLDSLDFVARVGLSMDLGKSAPSGRGTGGEAKLLVSYQRNEAGSYQVAVSSSSVVLYRRDATGQSATVSRHVRQNAAHTWFELRIVVTGHVHEVFINGERLIHVTDLQPLPAGHGLVLEGGPCAIEQVSVGTVTGKQSSGLLMTAYGKAGELPGTVSKVSWPGANAAPRSRSFWMWALAITLMAFVLVGTAVVVGSGLCKRPEQPEKPAPKPTVSRLHELQKARLQLRKEMLSAAESSRAGNGRAAPARASGTAAGEHAMAGGRPAGHGAQMIAVDKEALRHSLALMADVLFVQLMGHESAKNRSM